MRNHFRTGAIAISLSLTLLIQSAQAYPIFYSCTSDGRMRDVLNSRDIETLVLGAIDDKGLDDTILNICSGNKECFSVLKQALLLTQVSLQAANSVYQAELSKIAARTEALNQKIDPSLSETARNMVEMANEIYACRKAQENLPWSSFATQSRPTTDESSGYDLFIQHGVDNEYNFVSGIGKKGDFKISYDRVGQVVNDAVASNLDPYMALAVSFLESGKPEPFVLDMAPSVGMMGCLRKKIATVNDNDKGAIAKRENALRASGQPFIYSWGTFYAIEPGIHSNTEIYNQMIANKGIDTHPVLSEKPSLACFQDQGGFLATPSGEIIENYSLGYDDSTFSVQKACCMKVPYASVSAYTAMANIFVRQKLSSKSEDPAHTLQAFNGKGVIGITEKAGVGAFRYGIPMKSSPQYGAQGMDFILNSFMSNPMIRSFVKSAEETYQRKPKSLLCNGKAAGAYAIDSNHYVDQQRGMKRLSTVIGKEWESLSGLEKGLVTHEFGFVTEQAGKTQLNLSESENARFQSAVSRFGGMADGAAKWNFYRSSIYPFRDTLGKTSQKTWARLTDTQVREFRERILRAPPHK